MRTLLYIFTVRNAIKRKKDLFSLKRSATCAMAKNNLLRSCATSALRFKLRNAHLWFVPSLCRTYDITIAALPLYSVIALRRLRAQLSSAIKSNLLY